MKSLCAIGARPLTDIEVREWEMDEELAPNGSGRDIEIGLFSEGEWVEGIAISIERAEQVQRDLGTLIERLRARAEPAAPTQRTLFEDAT